MIRKKNYWLFSIILLASAESTYDAWGCSCCLKLCDKKNEKNPEPPKDQVIKTQNISEELLNIDFTKY